VDALDWSADELQDGKRLKIKGFPKDHKVQCFRVEVSTVVCQVLINGVKSFQFNSRLICSDIFSEIGIRKVDPHWQRGISYLKIGLRWLQGLTHKGRQLLNPVPLSPIDPEPCFASSRAKREFYDQFWFSRIRALTYDH
jgi:hypothetical protein